MEKTYSQKVARVFEIICYVLLAPTFLSLIYPVVFIIGGMLEGSVKMVSLGFIPFLIVVPGMILLVGYFKHSRGRLDEKYSSVLWLTTAVYNFLLFLPWLYYCSVLLQESNFRGYYGNGALLSFLFTLGMVFGYIAAITFSLKAFSFEKRRKYI